MKKVKVNYLGRSVNFILRRPGDYIQKTIADSKNFYEIGMLEDIRQRMAMREGAKYIVDVGAYIGEHSLFFATYCDAKVYAFEPFKDSYSNLLENIQANGLEKKIISYNLAVGRRKTRGEIAEVGGNAGMNRVVKNSKGGTQVSTLDELLYIESAAIDVLKIDVEGMEMDVLKGAKKIIARDHPLVYAEAFEPEKYKAIESFLAQRDYVKKAVFNNTPTYLFVYQPRPSLTYLAGKKILPRPVKKILVNIFKIKQA